MRDDIILKFKRRIGGVIGIRVVGLAVLVHTLRDMRRAKAAHGLNLAEKIVEDITPVAQHIENDAAALGLLVVPAWALCRLPPIAFEHPVAEFAANREHATEETSVAQHPDLAQSGKEQFVLHDAILYFLRFGEFRDGNCFVERVGDRLLAINVLARFDRSREKISTHLRCRGIEKHRVVRFFSAASRSVVKRSIP